ncbi:APC family permease [Actinomycetospora aeridis]|uniref:Amino acid permease n=1 Tax=Actinomycetospora aeridis TaxID=3129231 RepID=A0ABU8NAA3_9PSEU
MRKEASARKSVEELIRDVSGVERRLTRRHLIPLGLAVIIGSGAFNVIGSTVDERGVLTTGIALVLAAIACLGAAICFAEMASIVPVGGSVYTYTYATLGKLRAWLVGWLLLLQYSAGTTFVAISWARYVSESPLSAPNDSTSFNVAILATLLLLGTTFILSVVDRSRLRSSSLFVVIGASVALKVVALLIAAVVGAYLALAPHTELVNRVDVHPETLEVLPAFALLYFAYIGFDAVGTAAEEARFPPRDLPRAILVALAISAGIYLALISVNIGLAFRLGVNADLNALIAATGVSWISYVFYVGAALGLPSGVVVLLFGLSRIFRAIRRDGILTRTTGKVLTARHKRQILRRDCLLAGGISILWVPIMLFGFDTDFLTTVVNLATAFAFAILAISTAVLRYRRPDLPRTFRVPMLPLVTTITVAISVAFLANAIVESVVVVLWVALGAALQAPFVILRARRKSGGQG